MSLKNYSKNLKISLAAVALCAGLLSLTPKTEAAYIDNVLVNWTSSYHMPTQVTKKHSYAYKNLSYVNGYTYKQTEKDVTTTARRVLGYVDARYTRTYSTY